MNAKEMVKKLFEIAELKNVTNYKIAKDLKTDMHTVGFWKRMIKIPKTYNIIDLADLVGYEFVLKENR